MSLQFDQDGLPHETILPSITVAREPGPNAPDSG